MVWNPRPFLYLWEGVTPFRPLAAPPVMVFRAHPDWRAVGSPQRRSAWPLPAPVAETQTAPATALRHPPDGFTSQSRWTRLLCLWRSKGAGDRPLVGEVSPFLRQNTVLETPATSGPPDGSCASPPPTHRPFFCHLAPWGTDPSQGLGGRLVTGCIKP